MQDEREGKVPLNSEADLVVARKVVRDAVTAMGFSLTDVTRIVTAASELTRNVFRYGGSGVMHWRRVNAGGSVGIELLFEDYGPGIPDITQALEAGYSTSGGLGLGLPGAKRLMDEMEIESEVGKGTRVMVKKWRR